MTIAMLALAGMPATAGFIGKVFLIDALVDGDYTWLAIVLVIGSMISLGYYLRVVATMWMREAPSAATPAVGASGLPVDRRRLAGGRRAAPRPARAPAARGAARRLDRGRRDDRARDRAAAAVRARRATPAAR